MQSATRPSSLPTAPGRGDRVSERGTAPRRRASGRGGAERALPGTLARGADRKCGNRKRGGSVGGGGGGDERGVAVAVQLPPVLHVSARVPRARPRKAARSPRGRGARPCGPLLPLPAGPAPALTGAPGASSPRLQPNVDTRQKQLAAWCSLVLSYCRLSKQCSMTVMEAQDSPLFHNRKLQRILASCPRPRSAASQLGALEKGLG